MLALLSYAGLSPPVHIVQGAGFRRFDAPVLAVIRKFLGRSFPIAICVRALIEYDPLAVLGHRSVPLLVAFAHDNSRGAQRLRRTESRVEQRGGVAKTLRRQLSAAGSKPQAFSACSMCAGTGAVTAIAGFFG